MPAMEVTGVYEDTVELVLPGFGPVSRLVEEFVKVNFERKFETIIDLWGGVRIMPRIRWRFEEPVP